MRPRVQAFVLFAALGGCDAYDHALYRAYLGDGAAPADSPVEARDAPAMRDAANAADALDAGDDVVGPVDAMPHADAPSDEAAPLDVPAPRDVTTPMDVVVVLPDVVHIDASDVPRDVPTDRPTDMPVACSPRVVLNEYQALGATSDSFDEFIELYNGAACVAPITGWTLRSRAYATEPAAIVWTAPVGFTIPAFGYAVVAGSAFTGAADARFTGSTAGGSSAVPNSGAAGVFTAAGVVVDSVAINVTGGSLIEGMAFPAAVLGGSVLQRQPNGVDTNDNARDFVLSGTPTPGRPN